MSIAKHISKPIFRVPHKRLPRYTTVGQNPQPSHSCVNGALAGVGGGVDRRGINPWHPRAVAYLHTVYVLAMDLMCCFQGEGDLAVTWCGKSHVTVWTGMSLQKGGSKICFDSS